MKIVKEGVILLDNDNQYIDFISGAIMLADPLANVKIIKSSDKLYVHIYPSSLDNKTHLIESVFEANRRMKIKIHYSSSLKISKIISYYLDI